MTYTRLTHGTDVLRDELVDRLAAPFEHLGFARTDDVNGLQFALNLTEFGSARAYRRRSNSVFVISVVTIPATTPNLKAACYTTLIRTLSNLLIAIVPPPTGATSLDQCTIAFTTPEAAFYTVPFNEQAVFDCVCPIATAQYSTDNDLIPDLPPGDWNGAAAVRDLRAYGAELDRMGVLPTPFPLRQVLTEEELHHLYRIFGLTGISYGNLSVRQWIPEFSNGSFWMTARGVNKARLGAIGRDILMVRSFNFDRGCAHVSQPADGYPKARVSVDAVEHAMLYHEFPAIGAIVHVHAWVDGIISTKQNFPCGTRELAEEVTALVRTASCPDRAIVGLKNHGITVTGHSLEDIFSRLRGHLRTEVPMFA